MNSYNNNKAFISVDKNKLIPKLVSYISLTHFTLNVPIEKKIKKKNNKF